MLVSLITVDYCDLGIRSISNYLRKRNIHTRLIGLPSTDKEYGQDIVDKLKVLVQDSVLIGISFRWVSLSNAIQVYKCFEGLGIPIVVGGSAAMSAPELCLEHFDVVCVMEGERVMLELCKSIESCKGIDGTRGIWFRREGVIVRNRAARVSIPLDFDYSCGDEYLLIENKWLERIDKPPLFFPNFRFRLNSIFVMTARGCRFRCSYCINSVVHFSSKRNSIRTLIKQLVEIKKIHQELSFIFIYDDDFFGRPYKDIELFADLYRKYVKVPFFAYCSPSTISERKVVCLVHAGLASITMGIQSGSDNTNKRIYDRNFSQRETMKAANLMNKYKDVWEPEYQFMIFNPLERNDDLLATVELLQRLPRPFTMYPYSLRIFPGTRLHDRMGLTNLSASNDRAYELAYRNRADVNEKCRTLYLSSVLMWMEGRWSRRLNGVLPAWLLPFLVNKRVVALASNYPRMITGVNNVFVKFHDFCHKAGYFYHYVS